MKLQVRLALSLMLLSSGSLIAQAKPQLQLVPKLHVSQAKKIVQACMNHFGRDDSPAIAIAVFNEAGTLLAFDRKNNASAATIDVAMAKGKASARYGFATREMRSWGQSSPSVVVLPHFSGVTGGVPIKTQQGYLLGGIGVSGAAADDDEACAKKGLAAVAEILAL